MRPEDQIACQYKSGGRWTNVSWREYVRQIETVAHSLAKVGVQKGDRVGIMANTRFEWALLDFAIISLGAITVPIYPSINEEDFAAILKSAQPKILFLENANQLRKFSNVSAEVLEASCRIISFFDRSEGETWKQFISGIVPNSWHENFQILLQEADPENLVTIVYTSGTTGIPKGVSLTHIQAISSVSEVLERVGLDQRDVALSFLPYSHVIGRQELWGHAYHGYRLAFAESIEKVRDNLLEVEPTFIVAVPRIFEKIYSAVSSKLESNRLSRFVAAKAHSLARQKIDHLVSREPMSLQLGLENILFGQLFFNKIKSVFGRNLRFAVSGGAPLHSKIMQFFWAAGVPILEGYGLTETTGSITINCVHSFEFGTVGQPLGDVELKFGEDQEIFVRSKKVMTGYHHNPEDTAQVLTDGWFATGDIGELTPRGFLKITDRKKDLIKTAGGKFVAPQKLEAMVKENDLISQVHIHGDQRKFVIALLTLKHPGDFRKPETTDAIKKWMSEVNSRLASYESIKKYDILPRDFSLEEGELTPSLKLKRKFIDSKYKSQVEALYRI